MLRDRKEVIKGEGFVENVSDKILQFFAQLRVIDCYFRYYSLTRCDRLQHIAYV